MKKVCLILSVLFILLVSGSHAFGMEGHDHAASASSFRIDSADVTFSLDPETYQKETTPKVVVSLTDPMSGAPIYDADLYIKLEQDLPMNHSSQQMNSSSGDMDKSSGLDFGETMDMSSMTSVVNLSSFKKLVPMQMAGMFAVEYILPENGEYAFTLAVKSLAGKTYTEPVIYGGKVSYQAKSKAPYYRLLFVLSSILISGVIAVYVLYQRKSLRMESGQKMNLLDIPWLRKFLKSAWFQPVFQVPALLVFIVIMAAGLFDIQQGDRNIATLLMWTIWWAAIIFTFVFVGRIWCMMCPFGAVQDWIGRLRSMNRDFPRPMRNIYLSSGIFFVLTWWDSYSGIVNKPALTAWLLIGFFVVASGMALVFKGRSFCRYVCPIGGLIGIYSMFSPLELRNKCLEVCRGHKVKECIKGTDVSHPCPMSETPMTLDRNNYCNFCSECIKSCSQDNIVIRFRSFAKDLWVSSRGYLDEALLAMVLVGITIVVTGEMVAPWHGWMDTVNKLLPFDAVGIVAHTAREKATFLFVMSVGSLIIPSLLLLLASFIVFKGTGSDSPLSLKQTFVQFAYMFIPVGLSMHLAHNINHLFKEGPEIVPAVERVVGNIAGSTVQPDWVVAPLMGSESIFWLQMLVILIMNIFSLYAGYRIAVRYYGDRALRAFIPMAILAVAFVIINVYILGQPMAMRHTHGGI
ncbi:MAG: 4Fe-4S binding protein [Nitrospirae bacterium]|nr:4Fe-4S binding protein [Nitrospirota bacterium]